MLVFIALAASALLAAVAFGIAGRTTQFNYSVNEAELQYENIYEVIQDTADELTLDEIYLPRCQIGPRVFHCRFGRKSHLSAEYLQPCKRR